MPVLTKYGAGTPEYERRKRVRAAEKRAGRFHMRLVVVPKICHCGEPGKLTGGVVLCADHWPKVVS